MTEPRWLTVEEIQRLHTLQIEEFGGTPGVRDAGLLEPAVMRPRQRYHYGELKSIVDLAVAYAAALNSNHPFLDGNKRVAFHAMLVFLRLHGLALKATAEEATERMLALASGRASEADLSAWVRSRV
jgi:death-on-curing protein